MNIPVTKRPLGMKKESLKIKLGIFLWNKCVSNYFKMAAKLCI